jgi:cell division protein ZapA
MTPKNGGKNGSVLMNKVKLTVCGKEYKLSTETPENELLAIAAATERTITEFMSQARLSVQDAAVLAALDAYAEAEKHSKSVDNIRIQIQEYVSEAARARAEIEESAKSKEKLQKKHGDIAKKIDSLDMQIDELRKELEARDIRLADFETEKSELKKTIEEKDNEIKKQKDRIDILEKENEDLWKFKLEEGT